MRRRPSGHVALPIQLPITKHLTTVDEASRRDRRRDAAALGIKRMPESYRNVLHIHGIKVIGLRHEAQVLGATEGNTHLRERKARPAPKGRREPMLAEAM